jgi:hypothetical protein
LLRQSVQRLGCDVGSIRPDNGSGDWIKEYLSEKVRVSQRLEDRPFQQRKEVDALPRAIFEPQVEDVRPGHFDPDHSPLHVVDSLLQRLDPVEWAACARQVPILFELFSV